MVKMGTFKNSETLKTEEVSKSDEINIDCTY